MADNAATLADDATAELTGDTAVTSDDLADEVLVEEVSIDGMCGVY